MGKDNLRIIEAKVYSALDEMMEKGQTVPLSVLNILAIVQHIGYLRDKPKDTNIINAEVVDE